MSIKTADAESGLRRDAPLRFPLAIPESAQLPLLLLLLFVAALLIRLPNLLRIPRFEDESQEVVWALEIARGLRAPLTGFDAYYGPLFSYLVAGLFRLLGDNMLWPRLLVAVTGALTVPATYLLGAAVSGARAGLVAASVALGNVALVLFASHTGWSASLGPMLATLTLLATYTGVTERRPITMMIGGVLGGLLMQAHPLNAVLLVGLAVWYLTEVPPGKAFTRAEPYLAIVGFAIGYSPMLWMWLTESHAVMNRVHDQTYAYGPSLSPLTYLGRLGGLGLSLALLGLGAPMFFVLAALVARLTERRPARASADARPRRFLLCVTIVPLALLPAMISTFLPRYLGWLQPILYLAVGIGVTAMWPPHSGEPAADRSRRMPAWFIVTIVLVACDVGVLAFAETYLIRSGGTNEKFFALRNTLRADGGCTDGVVVEDMDGLSMPGLDNSWVFFNQQTIVYTVTVERCPVRLLKRSELVAAAAHHELKGALIVSEGAAQSIGALQPIDREMAVDPASTIGTQVAEEFRFVLVRTPDRVGAH